MGDYCDNVKFLVFFMMIPAVSLVRKSDIILIHELVPLLDSSWLEGLFRLIEPACLVIIDLSFIVSKVSYLCELNIYILQNRHCIIIM